MREEKGEKDGTEKREVKMAERLQEMIKTGLGAFSSYDENGIE